MIANDIYLKMIEDIEDYAILFLDTKGTIQTWNKGAEKIKGYTRGEIIGKDFKIFYTEEDQEAGLPQKLITEATTKSKAIYEGWRVRKDKTKFWGSIVATAIYGTDKELIGFTKVTRDLTEKKQAEEKLLQFNDELEKKVREQTIEIYKNEKRFRALVENNYEAIILRDEKGNVLYQSPGSEKLSGYTIEEVKEIDTANIFHPDDMAVVTERIKIALQNPGKPIYGMHRIRHKSGRICWLEGTYTNLLEDENIQALVGNFRDITERKQAEEKIIYANRLYAFVSGINQTIVHVKDEQTLYNDACRIAVEIGMFETAWISIPDKANKLTNIVAHSNMTVADFEFFNSCEYDEHSPKDTILQAGKYYAVNDLKNITPKTQAQDYAIRRGYNSFIALPIIMSGVTIGSFNLNSRKSNLFDEQEIRLLQEVSGDISFALDVFEKEKHRKLIEEKIQHSELRLKQAQSIAHFGSWEMDIASGIGIWSEETCRIYGLSPDNNIQAYEQWLSYVHPEDLDYVMKTTKEANDKFVRAAFFHRIIRQDGAIRHIYSHAEIEFKNGIPISLYGVVHDITDMKQAEAALQQSTANLNLIIDLIPQLVFVKDYYGKFIFTNKSFAELYGLKPEQLLNKTLNETIPENNEPEYFIKQDQEVIDTGTTRIIPEACFIDSIGAERIFHTIKVPFLIPGTNERAVLGISHDITEQKHKEEERTKMISDIVQRNKDLEQFSYIVSHNLRAPVANIIGLTDLMQITEQTVEEQKTITDGLAISARKLDTVIRDLNYILQLKYSVKETRELVRFSLLLSDISLSIQTLLNSEDAHILSNFSEVDQMLTLKSYIHSIFFNLISNSIKYRQHGVQPLIEINSYKNQNKLCLIFKDNGLGINLNRSGEQVFGLYKRFHEHVEGKGIGLYMVKTQVEALGGKIAIDSEINKGTTFTITFENHYE